VFKHPILAEHVSLSGADGEDAKNYEEINVARAIGNARKTSIVRKTAVQRARTMALIGDRCEN
jgi:hypothetical protein